jgi:hypothetical protein
MEANKECSHCEGTGYYVTNDYPFKRFIKCEACNGTGIKKWVRENPSPRETASLNVGQLDIIIDKLNQIIDKLPYQHNPDLGPG